MKKIFLLPLVVSSVTCLSACSQEPAATTPTEQNNFDAVYNSITADKIAPPLKTLASDEFEGRLPTTAGEKKTLDYLVSEFKKLGLEPGNGDSYLQAVELMEITADPDMTMTIGDHTFEYKTDMVAGSKREQDVVTLTDSELVFVGYGINARNTTGMIMKGSM